MARRAIGHRISPLQLVLDIDPRHGGKDTRQALKTEMPEFVTRTHYSGVATVAGTSGSNAPPTKSPSPGSTLWAREHGAPPSQRTMGMRHRHPPPRTPLHDPPPSHHPETGRPYYWGKGRV